ncbi:FecR family protein [Pseudomonas aegrilactucae]|uniref:FecR family protein n=1 Tax=Pseudomonas aegrilactucae TaxID=2854028 RepID=A0A9Q2XKJ0_9PSED|nr:FecR family protein [Pseudomonas aegrilactucae]MBV6288757.1 FecR family protein [Pseudomonas aegrilactucae]
MSPSSPASVRRQAAEWLVRLDHQPDATTTQAFADWLAADPLHAQAIDRLRGHLAPLHTLPALPAGKALRRAGQRRRPSRVATLALATLVGTSALLGYPYWQQGFVLADLSTGEQQWLSEHLPDGSQLELDARSAVDLQFDTTQRRVRLLRGEMLVEVAKDAQRPFYVDTPQGSIRALGTRFIVERQAQATVITMLESATQVDSAGHSQTVNAGQRLRFDGNGPGTLQQVDGTALQNAWAAHQVLAYDQPLPEVLERLARHRKGLVLFDSKVLAALRVTVMLPTDDSDRALRLLARTLPIQVRHYTPWVTVVSLTPGSIKE